MSGLAPSLALSYIGQIAVPWISRTFAPNTDFNKFTIPTVWVDTLNEEAYMLLSLESGVANWVRLGGTPGEIDTIVIPGPTTITPDAGNINFLNGTGVSITGSGDNITFNATGGGLTWTNILSSQTLSANNGYFCSSGNTLSLALPTTSAVGDTIKISLIGSTGFTITQAASQQIRFGGKQTTAGSSGSISSTVQGDFISLVCQESNLIWVVENSMGNLTIV